MSSFAVTNARVVLPEVLLDRGTVWVHDGVIAEVQEGVVPAAAGVFDVDGAYLAPGAIDLHNDNLEFEVNPRPGANLPLSFALATMERRLVAAGVTTEFHAIAFMEMANQQRSVEAARRRADYIAMVTGAPGWAVDHHVLHRIDVWHPHALGTVMESLAQMPVKYASLNDHTPGQGQYRDVAKLLEMRRATIARKGSSMTPDAGELQRLMESRQADKDTIPAVYRRVGDAVAGMGLRLATHDDDSPEKVDVQWELGARVAEFPVTLESAQRARDRGMLIVVGAPNILRGGSQSGNLPATDLIDHELADIICADYHAPSLYPAAFRLWRDRWMTLPAAVRMITQNAARAVGMADRGAIAPGLSADLTLLRLDDEGCPHVEATYRQGRLVFAFGAQATQPLVTAASAGR